MLGSSNYRYFYHLCSDYPAVIFTTAFEHYAIDAIKLAALDYLVNLHAIQRFNKEGYLNLNNGDRVMASRKKKDEIISLMSGRQTT